MDVDFGGRLREIRELMRLSQEQFGNMCGVKKVAQYNYERGTRLPDAEYLAAVSKIGGDVLYLLTGMRHENVARGSIELSTLVRFRSLGLVNQYAVVRLIAALLGDDKPPHGWGI